MIKINPLSSKPIYLQVVDNIKQKIANHEIKVGSQLPTIRSLADDLEINFNTIARAYRILDAEGIITTQHGRGTFVLNTNVNLSKDFQLRRLTTDFIQQATQLGFKKTEIQKSLENFWLEDSEPPHKP